MTTIVTSTAAVGADRTYVPARGWGPEGKAAALSITFDNLGEAAELELGIWDDQPVGQHHTATFIPQLVDELGDVRATYFMEASNVEIYPEAIKAWAASGNEVGLHAWRHEVWADCAPDRRRELLKKSLGAMASIGVHPVGFRPPGGVIQPEAWDEFREAGLLYCSELGAPDVRNVRGVMSIPFQWRSVDVYMIEDVMGFMRKRHGDPETPFDLSVWNTTLETVVADAVATGGHRTVIFHPNFLGTSKEKLASVRTLIAAAKRADVWIAPAGDVARFAAAELAG